MAKESHIYIYGDIWNEQIPREEANNFGIVNLKSVVEQYNQDNPDQIVLHIHSRGGDVDEGFAIFNFLKNTGKKITTVIEGQCASIATVVALAGDDREMIDNSVFMIHNPWGGTIGDADEHERRGKQLRDAEDKIAKFYHDITGADLDVIKDWMREEKEMGAKEAKKLGFITKIIEPLKAVAFAKTNQKNDNAMSKILSTLKGLKKDIKALMDNPDGNDEVMALDVNLESGVTATVEGDEIVVGASVTVDGEPAPDGEHVVAETGVKFTTAEGVITEVTQPDSDEGEDVEALKAKVANLEAKLAKEADEKSKIEKEASELADYAKNLTSNWKPPVKRFNKAGGNADEPVNRVEEAKKRREEYRGAGKKD